MEKVLTLRQFEQRMLNNQFDSSRASQCVAGWYDWFCKDSSLAGKTNRLGRKALQVARAAGIDLDKNYVWFKNNCPVYGSLYDSFSIAFTDPAHNDTRIWITPACGHNGANKGKPLLCVYDATLGQKVEDKVFPNWRALVKFVAENYKETK